MCVCRDLFGERAAVHAAFGTSLITRDHERCLGHLREAKKRGLCVSGKLAFAYAKRDPSLSAEYEAQYLQHIRQYCGEQPTLFHTEFGTLLHLRS